MNAPLDNAVADRSIGAILADLRHLSADQVEKIVRHQRDKGLRFGEAAVALGFASNDDVMFALAQQFPYIRRVVEGLHLPILEVAGWEADDVIGTLDEVSALSQLHDHAVYLHGAETYFVNKLDLEQKIAFVEKRDLDYYTQSVQASQIRIDGTEEETAWRGADLGFGDVTVTTTIPMFKKIRFHSRDSLGFEKLELPPQELETVAFWFVPPDEIVKEMARHQQEADSLVARLDHDLVAAAEDHQRAVPHRFAHQHVLGLLGQPAEWRRRVL